VRVCAILNPRAGLAARRALAALEQGRPAWGEVKVTLTDHAGHARELAEAAAREGYELVLAAGGDGTANEVASGLLGSATAFGVVPVGSGNGLARTLRIPRDPWRALALLETGVRRRMDVGIANGRPFLNVAGAGLDAEVGAEFQARGLKGARRGILPYVLIALSRALRHRPTRWTLEAAGQRLCQRALIVAFVNGREYGASAVIAPGARLDDGLLDIVVIDETPYVEMFLNAPRLWVGMIEGFRRYRRIAAAEATLTAEAPFIHHRDGEPEGESAALTVTVRPRVLEVLVPRATAADPKGPFMHSSLAT
jgi:YegS/Rv2252/BmrU family lipid kinase